MLYSAEKIAKTGRVTIRILLPAVLLPLEVDPIPIVRTFFNYARSSPGPWDSQVSCRGSCLTLSVLLIPGLEFERWLNATGPPLAEPDLSQGSSLIRPVETLFKLWTTEPLDAVAAASSVDITNWRPFQTVLFLDRLLDGSPLPPGEYCSKAVGKCFWYKQGRK